MKKQLLILVMILLPLVASAYDFAVDGIYYNFLEDDDNSVGVAGCDNSIKEVNIPMRVYYGGGWLKVKEICKNAFYGNETYQRSYVLPNSIEIIREYAFCGNDIYDITLPSSLKTIERCAFCETPIRVVKIPASVEVIGVNAFGGTWDTCPDNDESYCWARYPQKYEVSASNMYFSSVDGLLYDKEQTKLIDYPDGLGDATIHIPATVKEFKGAGTPKKIIVNSKTWYELDKWELPHYIVREYDDDNNLISGPTHVIYDGDTPLGPVNGEVIVPEGVECIGEYMFYLSSYYSDEAIYNDIKSVSLPSSLKKIGSSAFGNCKGMETINIPNGVMSIGSNAFYGCSGLTSVTIGENVSQIGSNSFANCRQLTDVYCLAENVPNTDKSAFSSSNVENATLYVPSASIIAYSSAEPWSSFKEIKVINGSGTKEDPYNVAGAIKYVSGLEADVPSGDIIYIKGKICSIRDEFTTQYGNATFYISDDGSSDGDMFFVWRTLYLGNRQFVDGDQQIAVGDDVVICGRVINYKGTTPETKGYDSYINTLNGVTVDELPRCAKPTIVYEEGKLKFSCETEGVDFYYDIKNIDAATGIAPEIMMPQNTEYYITVYAKKDGYRNSEKATLSLVLSVGKKGDVNQDGVVSITDAVSVVNLILEGGAAAPEMEKP